MDFTTSEEIDTEARDTQKKTELFSRFVFSVPMVSDTVWETGSPLLIAPYMKHQLTFLPCSLLIHGYWVIVWPLGCKVPKGRDTQSESAHLSHCCVVSPDIKQCSTNYIE